MVLGARDGREILLRIGNIKVSGIYCLILCEGGIRLTRK